MTLKKKKKKWGWANYLKTFDFNVLAIRGHIYLTFKAVNCQKKKAESRTLASKKSDNEDLLLF